MAYENLWMTVLAAESVSSSIDRQSATNRSMAEQKDRDLFLSSNYGCIILSKVKELAKKHFFKDDEYSYFFNCLGLNTNTTCKVLVGQELWDEFEEKKIIIFEKNYRQVRIEEFLIKNEEVRVVDKITDSSIYLIKLYGLPSKDIYFAEANKKEYDECDVGQYVKQNDEIVDADSFERKPSEDTWYNIPMRSFTTLEMEELIENCPSGGYVYFYYGDHKFPKEINDAFEKLISLKDYCKIIPKFTKILKKENISEKDKNYISENEELYELYSKLDQYFLDNPVHEDKDEFLDKSHITNSNETVYGYFIDEELQEDEVDYFTYAAGIIRVKKDFFDRYPVQARQKYCNIVNSIYNLGFWFEEGTK